MFFKNDPRWFGKFQDNMEISLQTARVCRLSFRYLWLSCVQEPIIFLFDWFPWNPCLIRTIFYCDYKLYWKLNVPWLYAIIMSGTRFRVNLHSIVAWVLITNLVVWIPLLLLKCSYLLLQLVTKLRFTLYLIKHTKSLT